MLTFFDYLRQRAFESVLTGAQEALELLESDKNRDAPPTADLQTSNRSLDFQPGEQSKPAENDPEDESPTNEDKDLLPPPRRRGRAQKGSRKNE